MKRQIILFLLLTVFFVPQSFGGIVETLEGKTITECANIKGIEIGKIKSIPKQPVTFSGVTIQLEILDTKAIEGGVEVLAQAWDAKNKQIGFGDGSVEIERFKIYNPPILVGDINGTIIRTWTELGSTEIKHLKLREDPLQALKESLTHTVKIVGIKNAVITKNKIGDTTYTFYSAAGAVEPVDGSPYRDVTGAEETWAALRGGAGTHVLVTDALLYIQFLASNTSPYNYQLVRSMVLWDSSPITDTDSVDSVTASLWGNGKADGQSLLPTSDIYTSTPASTSNLVAADYSQTGTVSQTGSPMTYAAFTVGAYNDYVFNATGRSNVSKTGISKFAWKNANYDANNVDPAVVGSTSFTFTAKSADTAGTSSDPKLTVVTSSGITFIPQVTWW